MSAAQKDSLALDLTSRRWALLTTAICILPLLLQLPASLALPIAAAGLATIALAWRQPLPRWLRLVLTLLIVGAVVSVSDSASVATAAVPCLPRCWRSSRRKPSGCAMPAA